MISINQHGFMRGRSTVTNLTCLTQFLCESLDKRCQVDVVYTDFSKAFDRLDHYLLLKKLESFGLSDSLIMVVRSYLCNRLQYVQHRGFKSSNFLQQSGVPQGSILGPLFFNMFVNDMLSNIDVCHLLYADDLKIYGTMTSLYDCINLQVNLDRINDWCKNNNLDLNASKCNIMSFSRSSNIYVFNYNLDTIVLNRPDFIKDLGVIFDPKLTFKIHVQKTCSSAYKSLGFVLRNSKSFKNVSTLRMVYTAFVRSRLEYASIVWNPIYNVSIDALENIQRRFVKYVFYKIEGFYPPRGYPQTALLDKSNLCSLDKRRAIHSIIFLCKVVNHNFDCSEFLNLIYLKTPRLNARKSNIFHLPTPHTNILEASPLHQMIINYTQIEESVDIFCLNSNSNYNNIINAVNSI